MSDKNWFYNFISDVSVSVDTGNLRTYSTQLSGVCKNSEKIAARIAKICKNFDSVNAIRTVNNGASIVKKCKQYIDFTASAFEDTENYLSKINPTDIKAIRYGMITAGLSDDPSSRAVAKLNSNARKITDPGMNKTVGLKGSASYSKQIDSRTAAYIWKKDTNTGDAINVVAKWQHYEKGKTPQDILDKEWGTDEEKSKKLEKEISIIDFSHSFFDTSSKELGDQTSWLSGQVFHREAHLDAGAGHSSKKGWYVEAEAGTSFSVLTGTLKGSLGDEVLGLNGSVNAEVGSVSGSLGFSASTKEGVGLNASLEADIVKVGLTGGFTVLGVDAEASANVKVGFGAHAKVGYKKGVVTCDIGAAFGLGFDLKFKVDVKKPVKAVKKAAKAAWRKIKSWF